MNTTLHEIVRVVQPDFLINASRRACRYETADGSALEPGYYFALWPARATTRRYDRRVRYFGPFETPEEARVVQGCAAYIGLVAAADNTRHDGCPPLTQAVRNAYALLLAALGDNATRLARCAASRR